MPASNMDHNETVTISIGLPTYNRASLLPRAIESILSQTFIDFELIIVDDGSTDRTKKVIDSFHDARVRYIRHETNKGLMASRNAAVRASRGKYLAFQDSDDWWHPQKLTEEVALLENAPLSVGAVYSQIEKRYRNGRALLFPSAPLVAEDPISSFLEGGYLITLQAVLMRRACIKTVGMFDEAFTVFGDAEFIIRLAARYQLLYNAHVRAYLEVQPDSISRNKRERLRAREYLFKKHKKIFDQYPSARKVFAHKLAKSFAIRGEWKKAMTYGFLSIF